MKNIRQMFILMLLIAVAVYWIEDVSQGQEVPSQRDIIKSYESAVIYSFRGSINTITATENTTSWFCGFVNSKSSKGFFILYSYSGGYTYQQIINWSGGYMTVERFLRINGTVVENLTDKKPAGKFRFSDPFISYLQMGFNGSKILHVECSQNLCTFSFEKKWSILSGEDRQMWSVTGRMIVDGKRPIEGRMRFVIRHQKKDKKWMEEKELHFEVAYDSTGWSKCQEVFISTPNLLSK